MLALCNVANNKRSAANHGKIRYENSAERHGKMRYGYDGCAWSKKQEGEAPCGWPPEADAQQEMRDYFVKTCGIRTATDFLGYFAAGAFEAEIAEVVKSKFPVKEAAENVPAFTAETQRLYVARARAAFRLATQVKDRVVAESSKPKEEVHPDLERPLDNQTIQELEKTWKDLSNPKFINELRPAPAFRNRVFRELKTLNNKLIPVEKAKSQDDDKYKHEPTDVPVGGVMPDGTRLVLEHTRRSHRIVGSCLEYVAALRLIMGTYAFCGSHMVQSTGEALLRDAARQVRFFTWAAMLRYCDEVMLYAVGAPVNSETERLSWIRRRDEMIRTEMAALMNEGIPGDEALATSCSKFHHMWIMRDQMTVAPPVVQQLAIMDYNPGAKRDREEPKGGKGKGKGKDKDKRPRTDNGPRLASTHNSQKLCGAFNSKRGCPNEKSCPQRARHVCSVILPNGSVCLRTDHGATGHEAATRQYSSIWSR